MSEKLFKAVLVLNWKDGSMRLIKKAPSKPEASEISVAVNITLELPKNKPISAKLEGKIEVPEHKVKQMVIERLEGEENDK